MGSPEEKERKRRRIRSHVTKDLHSPKYRQRIKEDRKKKVSVKNLSHSELVKLIQEEEDFK